MGICHIPTRNACLCGISAVVHATQVLFVDHARLYGPARLAPIFINKLLGQGQPPVVIDSASDSDPAVLAKEDDEFTLDPWLLGSFPALSGATSEDPKVEQAPQDQNASDKDPPPILPKAHGYNGRYGEHNAKRVRSSRHWSGDVDGKENGQPRLWLLCRDFDDSQVASRAHALEKVDCFRILDSKHIVADQVCSGGILSLV
ncbi:hypothetical protein J3458_022081 [Metarhizium acridum]|uniref:uncharacterized protein n=1 Tax=Metarhizium acridum TaxID=92637 RepID=UPI001C6AB327|nr:hypothetical protein J3458_022081 [Metarhizium acridum]